MTSCVTTCALAAIALAGCVGDPPRLFVDVITDYIPERHFTAVRTEIWREGDGPGGRDIRAVEHYVDPAERYLHGVRVAELDGPPTGPAVLRVTLLANDVRPIASRTAILNVEGDSGATVLLTRDCGHVSCPSSDLACEGGRCIDASCLPEAPEACEPASASPECEADADCPIDVACAEARCVAGLCLVVPADSRCAAGELCDETSGCVASPECGDLSCDAAESYCECPTDCSDVCGTGCCTGADHEVPHEIPEEPPPPDPPPGVPAGPGECVVVCCDGFTEITVQPDAYACRDAYRNCRPHGRVETMHFEDFLIYQRPPSRRCVYCCALCGNRLRFHRVVEVVSGCTVAAQTYCDTGTRGGLVDADWRDCAL